MRSKFGFCVFALLTTAVSGLSWGQSAAVLQEQYLRSGLPGLCVSVVDDQQPLYSAAVGWADIAAQVPYSIDTVQPIGSVSKTLIGLTLAVLADRGDLDLDQPIDEDLDFRLRNPSHTGRAITWRQLATHSSSIVDEESAYARAYEPGLVAKTSMRDFVMNYFDPAPARRLRRRFDSSAPGTRFNYSNMGASLAAVALASRLKLGFDDYTQKNILQPIGMSASSWTYETSLGSRNATLYDKPIGAGLGTALAPYALVTYADGGLRSSCRDLGLYLTEILRAARGNSKVLPTSAVLRMLTPQFTSQWTPRSLPGNEPNQGLFWQFRRSSGFGHSGGDPGLTAFVSLDLERLRGRVFLTNASLEDRAPAREAFRIIWNDLGQH